MSRCITSLVCAVFHIKIVIFDTIFYETKFYLDRKTNIWKKDDLGRPFFIKNKLSNLLGKYLEAVVKSYLGPILLQKQLSRRNLLNKSALEKRDCSGSQLLLGIQVAENKVLRGRCCLGEFAQGGNLAGRGSC